MAAAQAPQTQVRPGANHQPPLIAAGMGLLHGQNIANLNIHTILLEYAAPGGHRVIGKGVFI